MNGTPRDPDLPDDVEDRYRRAAALDPSRPSEAVRTAILRHAETLAAQRSGKGDEHAGVTAGPKRPAQVRLWRRPAIFGTLAAAALAGLLITPRWLPPHEDSRQKAAVSPMSRAPTAALPSNEAGPPNFVADEMRSPASPAEAARLAQQNTLARKFAPGAGAVAPRAALDGGAREGTAANAPAAEIQDSASARLAFAPPSPPAPAPPVPPTAPPAPAVLAASRLQSLTAAAGRRMDTAVALRQAAEDGDMETLRTLLSPQTDIHPPSAIDARDGNGRTALMLATLHGRREAVDALLAAGADPNTADVEGTTPLQAAVAGGQPEIIAALRRAGGR